MRSTYRRLAHALGLLVVAAAATGCAVESVYRQRNLVSDDITVVPAEHQDPQLVNSWGLAFNPFTFAWAADNGTGLATVYDGNGIKQPIVVTIPGAGGATGNPTGLIFYGGPLFIVTSGTASGAARFIFASEDGGISAWAPNVDPTNAIRVHNTTDNAVYKGLALSADGTRSLLYAADFHNAKVDVFDAGFGLITLPGTPFHDPDIPKGFAPFGIQAINGDIFVSYAKQDDAAHDDVPGPGNGFVNVFRPNGEFVRRLISRGRLNSPWGMVVAPNSFGSFGGRLLVGNFGDGEINAYSVTSGRWVGQLRGENHKPILIDGLWGLAFGNGQNDQPIDTLFFASGPNAEANGLYGRLDLVREPTVKDDKQDKQDKQK